MENKNNSSFDGGMPTEKFGFIKQEVNQKKWSFRKKKRLRGVLLVILLGILFGVIASISFTISEHFLERWNDSGTRVEVQPGVPWKEDAEGVTPGIVLPPDSQSALSQYEAMMKEVYETAKGVEQSLVTVKAGREINDEMMGETYQRVDYSTGIVLADNQLEYLILASYAEVDPHHAKTLLVTFCGGLSQEAEVLSIHTDLDFVILKVRHDKIPAENKKDIRVIAVDSQQSIAKGNAVISIDGANGKSFAVNYGTVIQTGNKMQIVNNALAELETNVPYYSGGFGILIDAKGALVGIYNQKISQGGDAIAALYIGDVSNELYYMLNQKKTNEFGVIFCELQQYYGESLPAQKGAFIEGVVMGSYAEQLGFRRGDVIVNVGEYSIDDGMDFFLAWNSYQENDTVEIVYFRNGKERKLEVKIK